MEMLDAIIERIKKNDKNNYFEEDETRKELAIIKYYHYWKLNWCGCGMPYQAVETVGKFLRCLEKDEVDERKEAMEKAFGTRSVYDNELLLCLAYTMDAAGLTDHGSSIGWAWLTQDGKDFLYAINEAIINDTLDF